jgi:hypothetical protein
VSKNHPLDFKVRFLLSKSSIMVWETEKNKVDESVNEVVKSWREFIKERYSYDW